MVIKNSNIQNKINMTNEKLDKIIRISKYTFWIGLGIVGLLLIFKSCLEPPTKPVAQVQKNTITPHQIRYSQIIDSVNKSVTKRDLKASKDTVRIHAIKYITKYIEIIKHAPDTCTPYLTQLYKASKENDSIKDLHIERQDSTIQDQFIGLLYYKAVTHNDTIVINSLSDSIPKVAKSEFKRGKRVGRKQMLIVGGVAIILVESANVVGKVKP